MDKNIKYNLSDIPNVVQENIIELAVKYKVTCLYGKLGAGKTSLLKELLTHFEIEDEVNSPTYSIVNQYWSPQYGTINHFDLYRIESPIELLDLGFQEYLDSQNYCFIEWPQIAKDFLPEERLELHLRHLNPENRELSIKVPF